MMKHSHSIAQFLRQGELSELTHQALRLQKLQMLLQEMLPPALAEHARAVSFTQGCLLIEVSNSSTATLLRYYSPTLLTQIRQQSDFANIASIKQCVNPALNAPLPVKPKINPHRLYSTKTSTLITQVADKIEFTPLKQALLKLAQHLVGNKESGK